MKHTTRLLSITAIMMTAVLTGCSLTSTNTTGPVASNNIDKPGLYQGIIKVGHLVALDMAPMFIAQEAGFFKDEGLNVETVFFTNPGDSNAALAGGDLQFNINPFTLPFLAQNQGTLMRIISNAGGLGIIEIVIQGNYKIKSISELKSYIKANPNKKLKIGTLKGDTLDMIIYKALKDEGMSYDDFEMIWFNDLLAMVQAFQTDQIDILGHIKPYTTDLVVNHNAVILTNNDAVWGTGTPNTTTTVMQSFLEQYPETVKAYLKAQRRGLEYMVSNPEKAVDLLVKGNYYRVDKSILLAAIQSQPRNIILKPNVEGMMIAINDIISQGYIDPVDTSVINTSFLDTLGIK